MADHFPHLSPPFDHKEPQLQLPMSPAPSTNSSMNNTRRTSDSSIAPPAYSSKKFIDHPFPSLNCTEHQQSASVKVEDTYRRSSPFKLAVPHPYARLYARKDEVKRRKMWNHVLEKSLFTPYELSTIAAPRRRTIYIASLEAHIDKLHMHLLGLGYWPVSYEDLERFRGLNSTTAKGMVAGLQYDCSLEKMKLLELERANSELEKLLQCAQPENTS